MKIELNITGAEDSQIHAFLESLQNSGIKPEFIRSVILDTDDRNAAGCAECGQAFWYTTLPIIDLLNRLRTTAAKQNATMLTARCFAANVEKTFLSMAGMRLNSQQNATTDPTKRPFATNAAGRSIRLRFRKLQ